MSNTAAIEPADVKNPPASSISNGPKANKPNSAGRSRAFLIFFAVVLLLSIGGLLYWLHSRQFESTDDAQIDAHLNPVTSRVEGTILRVHVEDNQEVKAGAALVDLDPRDFKVTVAQATAELARARSMVIAERPNVPITEVSNVANITGAEAEVAT